MKFLIAYRLLFSRYNLSFISIISKVSIFGLMLGVGILITVLSVMNGFEKELRDKILSFTSHVNIYPSDRVTIKDLENIINTDKNIKGYSIVQKNEVLLSSDEIKNIPVIVHNVNQDLESNASEISDLIIDGKFKLSSPQDIVIGNILANNLRVSIGDKIQFTNYNKVFKQDSFMVTGIFDSGIYEYNQRFIYGSDLALTNRDSYTYIKLKLSDPLNAVKISRDLFNQYSIISSNWTETHNALFQAIGNEKRVMFIILMLIIAITSFNIISSLSLLVLNKQKDIAVLISLGFSKISIQSIFIIQGIIIGIVGISLGVLLGFVLSTYINEIVIAIESFFNISLIAPDVYHLDFVPSIVLISDVYKITIISFLMVLLSSIYPAKKAIDITPSQSLNL
ncbi:MAG: ABC transporter permease [Pseudomonadota bacterium]|nr:ABC transporter permease [Pseudomonadota bacterium]